MTDTPDTLVTQFDAALVAHKAAHPFPNQHDDFLAGWNAALFHHRLTAVEVLREARRVAYEQGYLSAIEDMTTATHKDAMNEGAQHWLAYCNDSPPEEPLK